MKKGKVYFLSSHSKTCVLSDTVDLDTFCWASGNYHEDKLIPLRQVEKYLQDKLNKTQSDIREEIESREVCPDCNTKLKTVRRFSGSYLSQDQFDAVKAGDYYCPNCNDEATKSKFKFFWKRDLGIPEDIS
jgi:ribosomal protein L37AE/L43A